MSKVDSRDQSAERRICARELPLENADRMGAEVILHLGLEEDPSNPVGEGRDRNQPKRMNVRDENLQKRRRTEI